MRRTEEIIAGILMLAICAVFVVPAAKGYWNRHTWREENGLLVRDYFKLRRALAEHILFVIAVLFVIICGYGGVVLLFRLGD